MKTIVEIRAMIEPEVYGMPGDEFYKVRIQVYPDIDRFNAGAGIQKTYPLSYLKSTFDMIWEDIGKALKKQLMEDENG